MKFLVNFQFYCPCTRSFLNILEIFATSSNEWFKTLMVCFGFSFGRKVNTYLGPCQTSMMEHFRETSERLKVPLKMFHRVLNTPRENTRKQHGTGKQLHVQQKEIVKIFLQLLAKDHLKNCYPETVRKLIRGFFWKGPSWWIVCFSHCTKNEVFR